MSRITVGITANGRRRSGDEKAANRKQRNKKRMRMAGKKVGPPLWRKLGRIYRTCGARKEGEAVCNGDERL